MTIEAFARSTAIALALVAMAAGVASAQADVPQRMYRGLFGGPGPRPDSSEQLNLTVSFFSAYDDDLVAALEGPYLAPGPAVGGAYSGVNAGLTFNRVGRHVDVGVTAASQAQYYPTMGRMTTVGDQGALSFGVHGDRGSIRAMEAANYSPLFMPVPLIGPMPIDAAAISAPSANDAVIRETIFGYTSNVAGDLTLGQRTDLAANYSTSTFSYSGFPQAQNTWLAGATFRHHVTKDAALTAGYTEQDFGGFLGAPPLRMHGVNLGLDYSKALGRTHKTTIAFNFGTGLIDEAGVSLYTIIGTASLNREIGRSWVAQASYNRGLGLMPGFSQPYLSDAFSASLKGLLSRRFDLSTSATYTTGELGIATPGNNLTTYMGSARLRFAVTQLYALYGEYDLFRYDFGNTMYLLEPLPSGLTRQAVQMGLTLWLPLVR